MSFKEDLSEALVKAVGYYNSGSTPDEAIVKSAQEMNFNLDQTDRLVEKFNTARTINYFEKNPDDRTQNFAIASKEKVASIIRGEDGAEKKASVAGDSDGWHDYTCYDAAESDYYAPPAEKTAEESVEDTESPTEGYSYDALCGIVTKRAEFMRQHAKKLRDTAGMVHDVVTTELSKIASKVNSGYDPDERLALFKAACAGNPLLDSVLSLSPDWIRKQAESHEKRIARQNVIDLGDMQKLAEELSYLADSVSKADKCEKQAEEYEKKRREMLDRLEKIAQVPGAPFHTGSASSPSAPASGGGKGGNGGNGGNSGNGGKKDKKKDKRYYDALDFLQMGSGNLNPNDDPSEKSLGAASGVAHNLISSVVPKGLSEYIDEGLLGSKDEIASALLHKGKKDTSIADHIDNLRRSSILQDLYDNDPILSEADPKDLAQAYSAIIQSSPQVSLNKEIVRAILRQSVNSMAISPFDAKQWADLENVLAKNKGLSEGRERA